MIKYALRRLSSGKYVSAILDIEDSAELTDNCLHYSKVAVKRHVRALDESEVFECVEVLVTLHKLSSETLK